MASTNASTENWFITCIESKHNLYIYIAPCFIAVWSLLIVPLYFIVLYVSVQRWQRNKRSVVSNTDFFTYHSFPFELLIYCSFVSTACSAARLDVRLITIGSEVLAFGYCGLSFLNIAICFERYLAVVYPLIFLSLRNQRWIWVRNGVVVACWMISVFWIGVLHVFLPQFKNIANMVCVGTQASFIVFCSVQALRALRNPSPGEGSGVSQAKRKAFFTMSAIQVMLVIWFSVGVMDYVVRKMDLGPEVWCNLYLSDCLFEIPNSLILPLLFLHRAGKLPKCRARKQPGQVLMKPKL